jgi:putative hydrolase of the HAD superfamily
MKAIVFDIGQTLTYYPIPLNWSKLYRPAFESVAEKLGLEFTVEEYVHFGEVLTKYNTRINPREKEYPSDTIFAEILEGTSVNKDLMQDIKREFYSFFRVDTKVYPEAEETLIKIKNAGILTATLSDVPYGMDNEYALGDIGPLIKYIDLPLTSNDTGYRKPCREGLIMIADKLGINPSEMIFVADEIKDMVCAHNAGTKAILINRTDEDKDYGQDMEIRDLRELIDILR